MLNQPEYSLSLTPEALSDLQDILQFTLEQWGTAQQNKYAARLDKGFQTLLAHPQIGRRKDAFFMGCRCLHIEQHTIFYRIVEHRVEIIRILHDSRDFELVFKEQL